MTRESDWCRGRAEVVRVSSGKFVALHSRQFKESRDDDLEKDLVRGTARMAVSRSDKMVHHPDTI